MGKTILSRDLPSLTKRLPEGLRVGEVVHGNRADERRRANVQIELALSYQYRQGHSPLQQAGQLVKEPTLQRINGNSGSAVDAVSGQLFKEQRRVAMGVYGDVL